MTDLYGSGAEEVGTTELNILEVSAEF